MKYLFWMIPFFIVITFFYWKIEEAKERKKEEKIALASPSQGSFPLKLNENLLVSLPKKIEETKEVQIKNKKEKILRTRKDKIKQKAKIKKEVELNQRRKVIFKPWPARVNISVDKQKAKKFGPSFRQMDLMVGKHHFRFDSDSSCCVSAEWTEEIPSGQGHYILSKKLKLKPAALYILSNVLANVVVVNQKKEKVRGRTRSLFRIPVSHLQEVVHILLKAEGFKEKKIDLLVKAGEIKETRVVLEKE